MRTFINRPRVVLDAPTSNVPVMLTRANTIHDAMTAASSTFTAPQPAMATLLSLIQATTAAQQAATTRAKGLAAIRDVKVADLASALKSELAYVQTLVDASPEQGQQIAQLAGMRLKVVAPAIKPLLALSLGEPAGVVKAEAHAALLKQGRGASRRTVYNWRYTPDGGKTWIVAPSTPVARTTLTGLAALTSYGVQVCITDTAGTTAWTDTVTIVVH
jgi:hypothetical protein